MATIEVQHQQCGEKVLCVRSLFGMIVKYRSIHSFSCPRWYLGRAVHGFCVEFASY